MMTLRTITIVSAVMLALAGAGTAAGRPAARPTTVKVTAKDFSFVLSTRTVKPGRVTFEIKNTGRNMHDFVIAGHSSKTIGPGKSTSVSVMLKPGRYPYRCTVDSHAELGMKGILRVRR
jgi:plastocyanin